MWVQHPGEPGWASLKVVPDGFDGKNYLLFEPSQTPVSGKIQMRDGRSFTVKESLATLPRSPSGTTTVPLFVTLDASVFVWFRDLFEFLAFVDGEVESPYSALDSPGY